MTQATTAPRTLEGTKGLRNAPPSGHSLRRRADPRHRGPERARDAASGPRAGTPPVRHESAHGQPGRSRGRTWFAPAERTRFGCVAAAFLLLTAIALFSAPSPAQAATLVSNLNEGDNGASFPQSRLLYAQGFRTGATPTTLTGITVRLSTTQSTNQQAPVMTLHRGSAHSPSIARMSAESSTISSGSTENYSYRSPGNVVLSASTTYYMVLTPQGRSLVSPRITRSTGQDAPATGWSINDRRRWKPIYGFPGAYFDRPDPIMIAVLGVLRIGLSISNASGVEGRPAALTASLSSAAVTDVTVKWRIVPGTATADDYTPPPGGNTLTILRGQTSATLEVPLTNDTRHENPESFSVELYDAIGASLSSRRRATVTINPENQHRTVGVDAHGVAESESIDSDFPRVTLSGVPNTVTETSGSATTFTVQVNQENASDVGDFTVGIYTANGTARAPDDFTYLVRRLTFPKGTITNHSVEFSVADDSLIEDNETFEIRLGRPTLVGTHRLGLQSIHTVTIMDDATDDQPIPLPPGAPPRPPSAIVLVKNTEAGASNITYPGGTFSNSFQTGSHPDGYKLTQVRWQLTGLQSSKGFSVWISGNRLREYHGRMAKTLLTPESEIVLNPNAGYSFTVWTPNGITAQARADNGETGLTGWSIGDGATASNSSLKFEIRGAPVVGAPANLQASISGEDIALTWDDIANKATGIPTATGNGYKVQYCDTGCGDADTGWTHLATTTTNAHTDAGAAKRLHQQGMDGRSYRVRVFNGLHWPFSNVVKVTPPDPASNAACQAPNLNGRDAFWSGTMGAGTSKITTSSFDGSNTQAVGYRQNSAGSSLNNRDFNIASKRYRIGEVLATDDGLLKVTLANRDELTLAEKEVVRLHDCHKRQLRLSEIVQ